jgi:hypothetical protein
MLWSVPTLMGWYDTASGAATTAPSFAGRSSMASASAYETRALGAELQGWGLEVSGWGLSVWV